jgi:hypothetical protein
MKKRVLKAFALLSGIFLLSASIVWAQPAPVAKTGQTILYRAGDDGDLQKGVASPSPRFTDNGDGTVTDNLTGLMWAKAATLNQGRMTWNDAIDYVNNLTLGLDGYGTSNTNWRLPNVKEYQSLIDFSNYKPALPTGHPFTIVPWYGYWSSSTYVNDTTYAWVVFIYNGDVASGDKTFTGYVWAVRSGN